MIIYIWTERFFPSKEKYVCFEKQNVVFITEEKVGEQQTTNLWVLNALGIYIYTHRTSSCCFTETNIFITITGGTWNCACSPWMSLGPAILVQAGTNDRGQRISGHALFASRQKAGGAFATFKTILGRWESGPSQRGDPRIPGSRLVSWKNPIYKWRIG